MPMLALARPSVNEVWPLAANQNHRFNRPANDNNITSGLCTRTKFAYDGLGKRLKQTVGATETRYLWCGAAICQQRDGADAVQKRFYSEGEYVHSGTKKYLTLTDHLGSVRDVIDITSTPTLVGTFDYRPYGEVARSWGTVTTGYTYAGLFAQTNTGLLLSTTRAYNPANGKWLNVDPIREQGGINLTGYAGASPIMASDPSGLVAKVTVIGHQVIIELPIKFVGPGLNPAVRQNYERAIEQIWGNQSIYGYDINLKVTEPGLFDTDYNLVRIDPPDTTYPSGEDKSYRAAALCAVVNGNKTAKVGIWAANLTPKQVAHEAGHLLGLGEIASDGNGYPLDPSGMGNLMNNLPGDIGINWIQLRQIILQNNARF